MKKIVFGLFIMVISALGYWFYNQNTTMDFHKIVANSELNGRSFDKAPQEIITPGGIKFWLMEDHQIELISLNFSFDRAGTAYDEENKQGLSKISEQMLEGGTKKYDYEAYHNFLDLNGVSIGFGVDRDYFNGHISTPSYNKEQAFDMLKQVLFEPRLDKDFLKVLKNKFAVAVKTQRESPSTELALEFKKEIYGDHPYSRTVETMAESVEKLSVDDIKRFLGQNLNIENLTIGVAGNIKPDEALKFVDDIFLGFKHKSYREKLEKPILNINPETVNISRQTAQVITTFASKGTTRLADDFYSLYLANHIFGGAGLTSRLSLVTREKEGLTYGVYTYLIADENSPMIVGKFSLVPENYVKMKELLVAQMKEFATNGATENELNAAKDYLLASYNLRFKSTLALSGMLNEMQKLKLGLDFLQKRNEYIKNVTLEDVNNAAAKYFAQGIKEVTIGLIN